MGKIGQNLKKLQKIFYKHFRWFVLAACLLALLIYGLSILTAKPTVEIITTHPPIFDANNNKMREAGFQSTKKARRP